MSEELDIMRSLELTADGSWKDGYRKGVEEMRDVAIEVVEYGKEIKIFYDDEGIPLIRLVTAKKEIRKAANRCLKKK